jgi:hypothetical protein
MVSRDKHSSLLRKLVNYEQKKFYNIGPWKKKCDIVHVGEEQNVASLEVTTMS